MRRLRARALEQSIYHVVWGTSTVEVQNGASEGGRTLHQEPVDGNVPASVGCLHRPSRSPGAPLEVAQAQTQTQTQTSGDPAKGQCQGRGM